MIVVNMLIQVSGAAAQKCGRPSSVVKTTERTIVQSQSFHEPSFIIYLSISLSLYLSLYLSIYISSQGYGFTDF